MKSKVCTDCKKDKPLDEFHTNNQAKDKKMFICKECNTIRVRERRYKREYGITPNEYEEMYINQDGRCLICTKSFDILCVDHNHITGEVRGLLCRGCNYDLGRYEKDPSLLTRISRYLNIDF